MTNRVLIPYDASILEHLDVRQKNMIGQSGWARDKEWDLVFVRCPNCAINAPLASGHKISEDGTVNPSIWHQCPKGIRDQLKADDWHIFGILAGWPGPNEPS